MTAPIPCSLFPLPSSCLFSPLKRNNKSNFNIFSFMLVYSEMKKKGVSQRMHDQNQSLEYNKETATFEIPSGIKESLQLKSSLPWLIFSWEENHQWHLEEVSFFLVLFCSSPHSHLPTKPSTIPKPQETSFKIVQCNSSLFCFFFYSKLLGEMSIGN